MLITICARGGSKGVKNKNIRDLKGKPLISYTIRQAIEWGKANRVIVSTDSKDIADISKQFGAEVPFFRPKLFSDDDAPKLPAIRHALIQSELIYKEKYETIIDLDPTAPIRKISDIENCLNMFQSV